MKKIDFKETYNSFNLNCMHRKFKATDESLLAYFTVMEILHNLGEFTDWLNGETGFEAGDWMKKRINWLKEGHCEAYPNIWSYISKKNYISMKRHFMFVEEKKKFVKKAADEALEMLRTPYNLLEFIENSIEEKEKQMIGNEIEDTDIKIEDVDIEIKDEDIKIEDVDI